MAAHQAPPPLGFSRQEHWSGLPLPSPMHESEKWKWSRSAVSDSFWPRGLQCTGSSVHGIFQARVLEWGAIGFSDMFYYYILILTYFRTSKEVGLKLDPPQRSKFKYMSKQEHLPPVVLWGKQDYIISHLFSSLMCLFFSLYFSHVLTYVWNISC